ncbi:putative UDP-glucuronosyltransferase 2A3 [Halenospora varia]|nr:putative UDP-glucuronosyltransferase 2A3 [Halenospora varia]
MASTAKPLVIIGCTPVYGHLAPVRAIAKDLIAKGFEITFVSSSHWRPIIEEIGADFVAIEGYGDWYEGDFQTRWAERNLLPPGPVQLAYDLEECFIKSIPSQHDAMQVAIKKLQTAHPGRPIIQVSEAVFWGALPIMAGATGVKPSATLGIGVVPMALSSIDTAAFGPGILPDTTPEGHERNKAMNAGVRQAFAKPQGAFEAQFEICGAPKASQFVLDASYILPDRFLQMCVPSAEYPRSDAPSSIRFAGGLPKGVRDASTSKPPFWDEIVNNNGAKKVVAISQGSIALDYSELTIPTMEAFKDRPDILVVVALGKKDATLPAGTIIPDNVRVADWIPFDELLPHCSVFITNGGYGAFQHAISNGTPVVVGGATEDKPENAARAEYSGMGFNLRTAKPTVEQVRNAVDEVLTNPKYKARAVEMEKEMATFDPMAVVATQIEELAAGKHLE